MDGLRTAGFRCAAWIEDGPNDTPASTKQQFRNQPTKPHLLVKEEEDAAREITYYFEPTEDFHDLLMERLCQ